MTAVHRPLIGITCYAEDARFGTHDTRCAVLPWAYVEQVRRAGGRPLLIPPCPDGGLEVLDTLDGLLLAGGADVDPARYGERSHPAALVRPDRDSGEFPLARAALQTGLPLLGVCRGMQVMAVVAGGRLHQHLPELLDHDGHGTTGPLLEYTEHAVRFAAGSRCADLLGGQAMVNSYHHQGVVDPGRLVATGWSVGDDLIEALELPGHPFAVGVQWHPEDLGEPALFAALVAAARAHTARERRTGFYAPV